MRRRAVLALPPLAIVGACATAPATPPVHVVFFEDDSTNLSAPAMAVIQDAARDAARSPAMPVRVMGYVAPEPGQQPSVLLSRQRADRVAAELRSMGVAPGRILVQGRGAAGFAADAPIEARRVEIRLGPG